MRKTIFKVLSENTPEELPIERWYQLGSIGDVPPARPFGIYRLSSTLPGLTTRSRAGRTPRLEIWVHDDPGSYVRIDGILSSLEDAFTAVSNLSAAEGESIAQADFESRSPDLNDTGFRTICKMSSFKLVGKGQ